MTRRDVTGRQLANVYAQTLGTIFTEQAKPYEVELCVAEVAHHGETKPPELYRITYDGSIADEPYFVVMGGTTEPVTTALKQSYAENAGASRCPADRRKRSAGGYCRDARPTVSRLWVWPAWRWPSWMPTGRGGRSAGSPELPWNRFCRSRIQTAPNPAARLRTATPRRLIGPSRIARPDAPFARAEHTRGGVVAGANSVKVTGGPVAGAADGRAVRRTSIGIRRRGLLTLLVRQPVPSIMCSGE